MTCWFTTVLPTRTCAVDSRPDDEDRRCRRRRRSAFARSAVGRPLEWDQVVPYFGRREIVKGSVYSYYEFTSPKPLNDLEWAGGERS